MATAEGKEVPHLGVTVNPHCLNEDAHQVLSHVRRDWRRQDVKFKSLGSSGHINSMTLCYVRDMSDAVVLRVFEAAYEFVMDRKREIECTRLLNDIGITPKLHCIFNNGVCMDYIQAETFGFGDLSRLKDVAIAKAVARELAKVHSIRTYGLATSGDYDIRKDVVPFETLRKLLVNWPSQVTNPEANQMFKTAYPPVQVLKEEVESVIRVIEKLDQPFVFTHNDTNPSNILFDKITDKAILVDYELCGFGPMTYDLAVFLEFSATGLFPDIDSHRHKEDYQKDFLREYLRKKHQLDSEDGSDDITEGEVEMLYRITSKSVLLFYLMFGLAMVYQAIRPESPGVDPKMFMSLAVSRWEWYKEHKHDILSS